LAGLECRDCGGGEGEKELFGEFFEGFHFEYMNWRARDLELWSVFSGEKENGEVNIKRVGCLCRRFKGSILSEEVEKKVASSYLYIGGW
jgi:hypothetical protein